MTEAFKNPQTSHSVRPSEAPWNIAFNTSKPLFEWFDQPENKDRAERFSFALAGAARMEPPNAILAGKASSNFVS